MPPVASPQRAEHTAILFSAVLLAAIVATGFAKSYLGSGLLLANLPSPLVHVQAVLFVGWIFLLTVQIGLAASGLLRWHQKLGSLLIFWAIAMVCVGPPPSSWPYAGPAAE
jgi:hypothetical protein